VKVTAVPAQIVVAEAAMVIAGVTVGFTVMVTAFEVAVGAVKQAAVEVITQVTIFPVAKVELV
jgi:hypothetical protein